MLWLAAGLALAGNYHHQGRLTLADGSDLSGTHDLTFALYDAATNGGFVWGSATMQVPLQDGYYSVVLDIPDDKFAGDRWMQVTVDTVTMTPRSPVGTVPGAGAGGASGGQPDAGVTPATCSTATVGYLWYDTSENALKVCNGAQYLSLGSVAAPPGPPATLALVGSNQTLTATWPAVSGATSYQVAYEAGASITGAATVVDVLAGTTTSITGLTNDQQYAAAVRTVSGAWTSAYGPVSTATPTPVPPPGSCLSATLHPNNSSQDVIDIPVGTWACFISSDGWVYSLKLSNALIRTTGTTGLIGGSSRNYIDEVWTRSPGGVWRQTTDTDDPPTRQGPPNQMYTDGTWYGDGHYWLFSDANCETYIGSLQYSYQIWSGYNCSDGTTTLFWAGGSKHYINELRY